MKVNHALALLSNFYANQDDINLKLRQYAIAHKYNTTQN